MTVIGETELGEGLRSSLAYDLTTLSPGLQPSDLESILEPWRCNDHVHPPDLASALPWHPVIAKLLPGGVGAWAPGKHSE